MADTKRLKDFRAALVQAHRKADTAATATWRARRRALDLRDKAKLLEPTISNEGLRAAILATVEKIEADAMTAENLAAAQRSAVGELLELLGGKSA